LELSGGLLFWSNMLGCSPILQRTARSGKSPSAGGSGGAVVSKRPRRAKGGATERYVSGGETDEEDEDAFLAAVMSGEVREG
jgi:hypothetical protein